MKPRICEVSSTWRDTDAIYEVIGSFPDKKSRNSARGASLCECVDKCNELAVISPGGEKEVTSQRSDQSHRKKCKVCCNEHTYLAVISGDEKCEEETIKSSQNPSTNDGSEDILSEETCI